MTRCPVCLGVHAWESRGVCVLRADGRYDDGYVYCGGVIMRITYTYRDFNGDKELIGECQVHTTVDHLFYVTGITGPQGCSKSFDSTIYATPIRSAIIDLLGGREFIAYEAS